MSKNQPLLSIIIPAHNEAKRLPATLEKLEKFLRAQHYQSEIIVIENGSSDTTADIVKKKQKENSNIKLIEEKTRGKGTAIKRGLIEAEGKFILATDADLSTPIEEWGKILPMLEAGAEIVIGSREATGSKRYNEPIHRHFMGRIFNLLIQLLVIRGYQDTQCGFKAFRYEAAKYISQKITLPGMAFDVEILTIAQEQNMLVQEMPVAWYSDANSKVKIFSDTIAMIRDLFIIRKNKKRGLYL